MKLLTTIATVLLLATTSLAQSTTPSCRIGTFGTPCGAALQGSLQRGPSLRLDVRRAAPDAYAILILGAPMRPPIALPGGCDLVVYPRHAIVERTDATGSASFSIPLRAAATFDVSFQALIFDVNRRGFSLDTTNGVRAVCQ